MKKRERNSDRSPRSTRSLNSFLRRPLPILSTTEATGPAAPRRLSQSLKNLSPRCFLSQLLQVLLRDLEELRLLWVAPSTARLGRSLEHRSVRKRARRADRPRCRGRWAILRSFYRISRRPRGPEGLQSVESPGDLLRGNHHLLLKAFCRNSFTEAIGHSFRRSSGAEDPSEGAAASQQQWHHVRELVPPGMGRPLCIKSVLEWSASIEVVVLEIRRRVRLAWRFGLQARRVRLWNS